MNAMAYMFWAYWMRWAIGNSAMAMSMFPAWWPEVKMPE